jgi:hypothetical protein
MAAGISMIMTDFSLFWRGLAPDLSVLRAHKP